MDSTTSKLTRLCALQLPDAFWAYSWVPGFIFKEQSPVAVISSRKMSCYLRYIMGWR